MEALRIRNLHGHLGRTEHGWIIKCADFQDHRLRQ